MSSIITCCLARVPEMILTYRPGAMISIAAHPDTPDYLAGSGHCKLDFADIDAPGPRNRSFAATENDIDQIIAIARQWDRSQPILVNCRQGHRRSPAASYIMLCTLFPGRESRILSHMRQAAPYINLNRHMLVLADHLAGAQGRILAPLDDAEYCAIPPRHCAFEVLLSDIEHRDV